MVVVVGPGPTWSEMWLGMFLLLLASRLAPRLQATCLLCRSLCGRLTLIVLARRIMLWVMLQLTMCVWVLSCLLLLRLRLSAVGAFLRMVWAIRR